MATPTRAELVAEKAASIPNTGAQTGEIERKAQVDAMWEQMNRGTSTRTFRPHILKPSTNANNTPRKSSHSWMAYLGMVPKQTGSIGQDVKHKDLYISHNTSSDETKKIAATALSNIKDAVAATLGKGKIEVTEVRDFAGEEIEVKKFVDADSKEATEKMGGPTSAVDVILEQIKKKPKLSVLDKTKKDWGEFKGDQKGLEEELDAYKKSSNQYLDKVKGDPVHKAPAYCRVWAEHLCMRLSPCTTKRLFPTRTRDLRGTTAQNQPLHQDSPPSML